MEHLYSNSEGELVVANSIDEAARCHDCELGGAAEPEKGWHQIDDNAKVPIMQFDSDKEGEVVKTAKEWAEECDRVCQVATTYW
jgi:hypothetical protein